ncbi:MAG: peptide chain release factor-like protein [Elusimicrobiota bacterium]
MNLNEKFDVRPEKVRALKERIVRLRIDLNAIAEGFTKGGGKGGQKVNKTSNCVVLRYPPLELTVRCAKERRRTVNRFLALRELVDQIEMQVSPATSQRLKDVEKLRKKKKRKRRNSLMKHA